MTNQLILTENGKHVCSYMYVHMRMDKYSFYAGSIGVGDARVNSSISLATPN